ncbi:MULTISPECIES: DUF3742 family protein [Pseudomonadota]|jgi:hypothetical protein|uniref:DUF3742 family protein n=1 Tax=Pseudomonadota TaxID=1224 RepID=UPI001B6FAC68|nr:DUF3742 family protein [Achromobacter xylosoxidans]MBP7654919.1 DUF3742 family protein [Pseudoxanthomonas sp.]MCH4578095.1 DUF3742 family protein [Achromobacter xylosoxidans]
MNTTTRSGTAERLGRWLGRGWRAYARGERRVSGRLVSWGLPSGVAVALLWAAKLSVLGVLLYAAFWLALALVLILLIAGGAGSRYGSSDGLAGSNEGLRHGEAGFGYYSSNGHRLDPHDPNGPFDQ